MTEFTAQGFFDKVFTTAWVHNTRRAGPMIFTACLYQHPRVQQYFKSVFGLDPEILQDAIAKEVKAEADMLRRLGGNDKDPANRPAVRFLNKLGIDKEVAAMMGMPNTDEVFANRSETPEQFFETIALNKSNLELAESYFSSCDMQKKEPDPLELLLRIWHIGIFLETKTAVPEVLKTYFAFDPEHGPTFQLIHTNSSNYHLSGLHLKKIQDGTAIDQLVKPADLSPEEIAILNGHDLQGRKELLDSLYTGSRFNVSPKYIAGNGNGNPAGEKIPVAGWKLKEGKLPSPMPEYITGPGFMLERKR